MNLCVCVCVDLVPYGGTARTRGANRRELQQNAPPPHPAFSLCYYRVKRDDRYLLKSQTQRDRGVHNRPLLLLFSRASRPPGARVRFRHTSPPPVSHSHVRSLGTRGMNMPTRRGREFELCFHACFLHPSLSERHARSLVQPRFSPPQRRFSSSFPWSAGGPCACATTSPWGWTS